MFKNTIRKFNIKKTCCFTGHRPQKISWGLKADDVRYLKLKVDIKNEIEHAIKNGYITFISGMALGFDTMCAETVLELQAVYPKIKLVCAVPCHNQTKCWTHEQRMNYFKILIKANKIKILSKNYTVDCMQKRNKYMVDNSSLIIALFNNKKSGGTYNTIMYAKSLGKDISIINTYEN